MNLARSTSLLVVAFLGSSSDAVLTTRPSDAELSLVANGMATFDRQDALRRADAAALDEMHAKVLCKVDVQGVSTCMSFPVLKEMGKHVHIWAVELERAYDEPTLDKAAPALVRCADGRWSTASFDVDGVLDSFVGAMPEAERAGARIALRSIALGSTDAPLHAPGSAFVEELASACPAAAGGGGASSEGSGLPGAGASSPQSHEEESRIDAFKSQMESRISATCSSGDALASVAAGGGEAVSPQEALDLTKTAYEFFRGVALDKVRDSPVQGTFDFPEPHSEGDRVIDDKLVVTVEISLGGGSKVRYMRGDYSVRNERGELVGGGNAESCFHEDMTACTAEEIRVAREAADKIKAEAKAQKQADDEKKKAAEEKKDPPPPPPAPKKGKGCSAAYSTSCIDSCQALESWWSLFQARCDASGWKDYHCESMLNLNCADSAVIYPTPDGEVSCQRAKRSMTLDAKQACEDRQKIMLCLDGPCACESFDLDRMLKPDLNEMTCDPHFCDPGRQF
jgi:hypothetical protein